VGQHHRRHPDADDALPKHRIRHFQHDAAHVAICEYIIAFSKTEASKVFFVESAWTN
jgi:hypothetical protein